MNINITTMNYYRSRYWFFYFRKNKFIKGFVIRLFGIHAIVKEKDSLNKLIHIADVYNILKENGIKYK